MGILNLVQDSFRRVFESASDRELRRRQAISRTEAELEKARKRYEGHARRYRQKAVEALRIGSQGQYAAFKRDFKRCIGAERRLAQLQLAFEGAVQRMEEVRLVSEFCQGMESVSRALRDAMKQVNLTAALKNFSAVSAQSRDMQGNVDQFLDIANQMSLDDDLFGGGDELVTDEEIDELLQGEAALAETGEASGIGAEISAEMKELDKLQRELGGR